MTNWRTAKTCTSQYLHQSQVRVSRRAQLLILFRCQSTGVDFILYENRSAVRVRERSSNFLFNFLMLHSIIGDVVGFSPSFIGFFLKYLSSRSLIFCDTLQGNLPGKGPNSFDPLLHSTFVPAPHSTSNCTTQSGHTRRRGQISQVIQK